jgi:hypothetical protein
MRLATAALALSLVLLPASTALAADPVYIDQLIEMPLPTLQQQFPGLKKEGCYRIGDTRWLFIAIDKKEPKPWRVVVSSVQPCKRAEDLAAALDVRERAGVELGQTTQEMLAKLGRPDASAAPESAMKRLGEIEYFYICRVSEGCARHKSVFVGDGKVTAIAEWYSE